MISDFSSNFYLPDGKNSKISLIINKWIFGRQTPDGNEGVGVKIPYLECAYGTKYYVVNKINGNISAIHDNSIEPTDFFGCFSPFNLKELELDVCRIADHHNGDDDTRLDDEKRQMTQNIPAPQQPPQLRTLWPFHELIDMVHDGQVFSTEQYTDLYFKHVEVINDLVESFQMYSTHILNHPETTADYRSKQSEQASYYERVIRNISIVLQMDQVSHIHEDLPQVPSPRYVPTWDKLDNIRFILQSAHGDADILDKEMQIIHKDFINERESRNNHQDSHSRLWNIDNLTDIGFNLTRFSPIPTIGDTAPQTPVGSGTTTPVPTSTPRPSGGSRLNSSDPTSNKRHTHEGNLHSSFTGVLGQVEKQNPTGAESGPKTSGQETQHLYLTQQNSTQVRFLSEIKEQIHNCYIMTLQEGHLVNN